MSEVKPCKMRKETKWFISCTVVACLLLIGGAIALIVVSILFKQNLEIKEGSIQYENWYEPTVPLFMQWYLFNLTNSDEVLSKKEKPKLQQLGPYTYHEHRKKVNITWQENGTVTYNNLRWWTFDADRSEGQENDTIITANLPLVTVAESLAYEPGWLQLGFTVLADQFNETAFKTYAMKDVIWGYHDPLMTQAKKILPHLFYTDFVGVFAGKNYTNDGTWTVKTGVNDISEIGLVDAYNGSKHLNFWSTPWANMVNGTDGSINKPGVTKQDHVEMFIPDICRSLYGAYAGDETTAKGIPLYRYSSDANELANASANPDNAGFCTPKSNCLGAGVINLTSCQILDSFNIPIIASMPHFLYADQKYLGAVEGLSPDPIDHRTDIAVEPRTGMPMRIARRMQINMYLKPIQYIAQMADLPELVLPVVWLNESMLINSANEDKFLHLMKLMNVGNIGGYIALGIGSLVLIVTITVIIILFLKRRGYERMDDTKDIQ